MVRLGALAICSPTISAWSHDGKALAYTRGHELFLCNPDGTGSRWLATVPGGISFLTWSPDDRRLGFTVFTEQQSLWEVEADGHSLHQRRLNLPGKAMECCGAWTPDGHYYVFRSQREGSSNLWAVEEQSPLWRRGNPDPVQLTFGPMNYYQPLPSRNGRTIFAIGTLPSGELVRYDAKQKRLRSHSARRVRRSPRVQPRWAMDYVCNGSGKGAVAGTQRRQRSLPANVSTVAGRFAAALVVRRQANYFCRETAWGIDEALHHFLRRREPSAPACRSRGRKQRRTGCPMKIS